LVAERESLHWAAWADQDAHRRTWGAKRGVHGGPGAVSRRRA